jgi:hypothetical protein
MSPRVAKLGFLCISIAWCGSAVTLLYIGGNSMIETAAPAKAKPSPPVYHYEEYMPPADYNGDLPWSRVCRSFQEQEPHESYSAMHLCVLEKDI